MTTAGQHYCADCGQLLSAKKQPTKTVAQKAPSRPKKAAPPLNLKVIEAARKAKPAPAKTKAPAKAPIKAPPKPRLEPEPELSAPEARPVASGKRFHHKTALRDAFKSLSNRTTLRIAVVATLLTTVCEVAFAATFAKTGLYAITESFAAGSVNTARATTLVGHVAWACLLGFVGYLVYHYALAAIIFKTSRIFDRRRASTAQIRQAALGSLAGMFIIDILTWLFISITALLVAGANFGFLGTKSLGAMGIVLAVATNLIAIYAWLGLLSARHMATYAIVLGQVGVLRAYATGWTLFNRQFGRIVTGLMLIVVVSAVLAIPASILQALLGNGSTIALVITTLATTVTQAVILIISAVYFLRLYRYAIAREYDSELGHLLSGRQPQSGHVKRRLVALGVITAAWVVVMTSLIIYADPLAKAIIR